MRIGTSSFVNQRCALTLDFESVLLAQALKIVLQHDLPIAAIAPPSRALEIGVILLGEGWGDMPKSNNFSSSAGAVGRHVAQ
jgi:hypothetical protein